MKQVVLISVFVISCATFAYAAEEVQAKESDRYTAHGQIVKGISNVFFEHDSKDNARPPLREKRDTPLDYNKDGTISLRCRFSPELCGNERRRTRREGKRLISLYLKPPAEEGAALYNLRKAFGIYTPKGRTQAPKGKGQRVLSLRLRQPRPTPKPNLPNNIYTRAFQRFSDDFTRSSYEPNYRPPRPIRQRRVQGRSRPRGRRAPARPRHLRRTGKGKEIFSLFLKKPVRSRTGRLAPPRSAGVPLRCKFQPRACGNKGKKLFSITYKGFKNVFPYAFPLI